jgi:AcrR family transcriptional regulator
MAGANRKKVLQVSLELFNQEGAAGVTTNHIARAAGISPGNLYFHFKNKEQIIRELFLEMASEIHQAWSPLKNLTPFEFLESSFATFWRYRFFHREMYPLRRKDSLLSAEWKAHMRQSLRLVQRNYVNWRRAGLARKVTDPKELRFVCDLLLLSSSSYLGFFESAEKPASQRTLRAGIEHVTRLIGPYLSEKYLQEIQRK